MKGLSFTAATRNKVLEARVTVFKHNMDLIGIQSDNLCVTLIDIGLAEDVVAVFSVTDEDCKLVMYHMALMVSQKFSSWFALKPLVGLLSFCKSVVWDWNRLCCAK